MASPLTVNIHRPLDRAASGSCSSAWWTRVGLWVRSPHRLEPPHRVLAAKGQQKPSQCHSAEQGGHTLTPTNGGWGQPQYYMITTWIARSPKNEGVDDPARVQPRSAVQCGWILSIGLSINSSPLTPLMDSAA